MTAGIIRIRSHVSALGRRRYQLLPGVEMLIDHFGQFAPEAPNLHKILDSGTQYSLQAAELLQQLASLHRTQARDGLEYRLAMPLRAFATVPRDGEPMRLVAHPLDQMQRRRIGRQDRRRVPARQEELFLAGPPVRTLGD